VIRCEEAVRALWAYLSDEISAADRAHIIEHLDACRRCCGELAFLDELRRFIAGAATGPAELPADVGARMEAFLSVLEGSDDRPDAQG
jgi:anti-sigma factor RsiW